MMACPEVIKSTSIITSRDQVLGDTEATSPGTVVNAYCQDGYTLVGSSRLTCQSNGQWSGTVPTCVIGTTSTGLSDLSNEEIIVIAAVGAVVGVVLIGIIVLCVCYQMKKRRRNDKFHHYSNMGRDHYIHTAHMDRGSVHSNHSLPGMKWYNDYSMTQKAPEYYSLDRAHMTRTRPMPTPAYATYDRYDRYDRYDDPYDSDDTYRQSSSRALRLPRIEESYTTRPSYNSSNPYYGNWF